MKVLITKSGLLELLSENSLEEFAISQWVLTQPESFMVDGSSISLGGTNEIEEEPETCEPRNEINTPKDVPKPKICRKDIKNKLEDLGVMYDPSASTKALTAKLNKHVKDSLNQLKEPSTKEAGGETLKEETVLVPFAEVRDGLIDYVAIHGEDKARELLESFNAEKISDLTNDQKIEIMKKMGVKNNEK